MTGRAEQGPRRRWPRQARMALALAALAAAGLAAAAWPAGGALRRQPGAGGSHDAQDARLGEIHFPTSGAPAALPDFERGVLLLHSFEYDDAAAAFRAAQARDPGFAMAYWGEAMTFNHPLWHQQDRPAALAALGRLAPTAAARQAKAPTARERGWLAAVEALYGGGDETEKAERDRRYAGAMERLHAADPADQEAAAFYALALLGSCEQGRDVPTYMRAAAVAEEVFAANPRHPGAVHYLIHAYDDPVHAPLGLRPARVYARLAPAAAHALHMPSHIFLALGLWDEVVAANEASAAASEERRRRLGLGLPERGYHALSWLHYAYLQEGRVHDARRLLAAMQEDVRANPAPRIREHLALMQAGFRIETRDWKADLGPLPDLSGIDEGIAAAALFAHGMAARETGDLAAAQRDLAALDGRAGRAHGGGAPAVLHGELDALLRLVRLGGRGRQTAAPGGEAAEATGAAGTARAAGTAGAAGTTGKDAAQAVDIAALAELEHAAAAEDAASYEFGPPVVVKPAHELAGELLLALGRAAPARRHFEQALARAPRRTLSLLGLARAAAAAGDHAAAAQAVAEIERSWRRADADLPDRRLLAPLQADSPRPPAGPGGDRGRAAGTGAAARGEQAP